MGMHEVGALEGVGAAIEMAILAGGLRPGTRGWKAAREKLVAAWLTTPRPEFDGRSALVAIRGERLEMWLGRSPTRRTLIEPLSPSLLAASQPPDLEDGLGPLLWLLRTIGDGTPLTATGNLNRALVREAAVRWWGYGPDGPRPFLPIGEFELPPLEVLHDLAQSIRAIRRRGKKVALTRAGTKWTQDVESLWRRVAARLVAGETGLAFTAEVSFAALLKRERTLAELGSIVLSTMTESGWRRGPGPLTDADASALIGTFVATAEALRLFERDHYWGDTPIALIPFGRETALESIRSRAFGPRTSPFHD